MEALAERLVSASGLPPGSPISAIARRHGHQIEVRPNLPPEIRGVSFGTKQLFVEPCSYAPRFELNIGHELAHYYMPWLRHAPEHEQLCQRFAAALCLPLTHFVDLLRRHGTDLAALRRECRFASWEAIASRVVDVSRRAAASKWSERSCLYRRSRMPAKRLASLQEAERAVVALAMGGAGYGELSLGGARVRAWRLLGARPKRAIALSVYD